MISADHHDLGFRSGGTKLRNEAVKKAVEECTDGLGNRGRVLLRASGTEPVLRVMAEAETYEECEKNVDHIIDAMKWSGHLVKVR